MCLSDDSQCELLILRLVIVAKFILWLAIRCFVVPEPDADLFELAWELSAAQYHKQ